MKSIFTILLGIALFFPSLHAQSPMDALKEVFDDAEYFFHSGEYNEALLNYLKIYRRGQQNNSHINYRIGVCYLNSPDKLKAITHLEVAVKKVSDKFKEGMIRETLAPLDAHLYLGNAYRINNELEKAIKQYEVFNGLIADPKSADVIFSNKQIESAKNAIDMQRNPLNCDKEILAPPINNSAANFNAVVSADENVMVYINRLRFYDAIYFSRKVNNSWSAPENITPFIQSDGNQYCSSLSADGKILLLSKEDNYDSDIYISNYDGRTWSKSVPVGKNINTKYFESHASISPDGQTLYFASNRKEKNSKGEMDLYYSVKDGSGEWGLPQNIDILNSNLNEDYPFISEDGLTLYFCSQGHKNTGGYDIFSSTRNGDSWSDPVNIGYPINTTGDDIFYQPVKGGMYGYQALYPTIGGHGDQDIVRWEIYSGKNPAKVKVMGNLSSLGLHNEKKVSIKALNTVTNDTISVLLDIITKDFNFRAKAGVYELLFFINDTDLKKSKPISIPATAPNSEVKIIPELLSYIDRQYFKPEKESFLLAGK